MSELLSTQLRGSGSSSSTNDCANVFPIIIIIINRQFRSHQINQVVVSINKRLICYGNELTNREFFAFFFHSVRLSAPVNGTICVLELSVDEDA